MLGKIKELVMSNEDVDKARKTMAALENKECLSEDEKERLRIAQDIDIKRRTAVASIIGSTGALVLGTLALISTLGEGPKSHSKNDSTTATNSAETVPENEAIEKKEVTLGNIRLHLQDQGNLSNKEVNILFKRLEAAYAKLTDYFGTDIMTAQKPIDCPIIIKPKTSAFQPHGRVTRKGLTSNLNRETGELTFTPQKAVTLTLSTPEEDYIAHEMVHLFVQAQINLSETFFEGQR